MSFIQWAQKDPNTIEQAIKALVVELYRGARPIDGRGGDDGRDLRWDSTEGLVIFEIKSFAGERLKRGQKKNIERSLKHASEHSPARWILILPLAHSPSEEQWFDQLNKQYPAIHLEWWGIDWLNVEFGKREYLRRLVGGEEYELLRRAQEFEREQQVPSTIADSIARINVVASRSQELSPYWRADFATAPEGVTVTYNERFPGAAALDPLQLRATFSFPASDSLATEVQRRLADALDYGDDVEIDGRYVANFEVLASPASQEMFETAGPLGRLRITSLDRTVGENLTFQLVIVTPSGKIKGRLPLQVDQHTSGRRGVRLKGFDTTRSIEVDLTVDRKEQGGRASARITWRGVAGKFPYAIRPAFEIFGSADKKDQIELRIDDQSVVRHAIGMSQFLAEVKICADMVVALEKLQNHCGQIFPIPDGLTYRDALDLVAAARLLSGNPVATGNTAITATIKSGHLASFLEIAGPLVETHVRAEMPGFGVTCGIHQIDIGRVSVTTPLVRLANLAELRAMADDSLEKIARYECIDGESIYMQLMVD